MNIFAEAVANGDAVKVKPDQQRIINFIERDTSLCIGTSDLTGCTVIAIVSDRAAIVGHINKHPARNGKDLNELQAAARIYEKRVNNVLDLFLENEKFFPIRDSQTKIIIAIYEGKQSAPFLRDMIDNCLETTVLEYANIAYIQPGSGHYGDNIEKVFFVDGRGEKPIVFVEEREVRL
ncbi:hypothetical protein L228DRAFT_240809 [Xylona heveae TC161]|uniref:Uncharacterized protein n=1 Tax=Xylona heveae (strain CBS 132557 / TC161) TaxID=1328760 RepID=A0A165ACX9_XYLHT|nr:hypothetical protein L228DRAFT_240809 [Xylona heveae TC161]KZF20270.1 hypothetical protein L228DRAFT_240809 [Xylona heveae TC161]